VCELLGLKMMIWLSKCPWVLSLGRVFSNEHGCRNLGRAKAREWLAPIGALNDSGGSHRSASEQAGWWAAAAFPVRFSSLFFGE